MKKYKNIFSSFHTLYRLVTTSSDIKNFAFGISRLYKNTFNADTATIIFRNVNSYSFMKISLKGKKYYFKKGGISILERREKEIINREKEILGDDMLIYPFVFSEGLGAVYIKRRLPGLRFNDLEKKWFL